jgi:hypothetical protein
MSAFLANRRSAREDLAALRRSDSDLIDEMRRPNLDAVPFERVCK